MKKFFIILLTSFLILFSSCGQEEVKNVAQEQFNFNDFQFTLPVNWHFDSMENDTDAKIKVPDEKYDVYMIMSMVEMGEIPETAPVLENNNVKIYDDPCGESLTCYKLSANDVVYSIVYYIDSNEPIPDDFDGLIWYPKADITDDQLVDLLATAEKI